MTSSLHLNSKVQLNYASLELLCNKSFSAEVLGWLDAEERIRFDRFVSKQQAHQFLLARALLRSQLSKRVPTILPREWVFSIDEYGKPRLADEFTYLNLHFNLSHSEGLVVLALGEGVNLGIDVEYTHRPVFSMALAKRYFSENELADLMRLTEQSQIKRIAQLWTLKESYLKTNGLGVRVPLTKLEFYFKGGGGLEVGISSAWVKPLPAKERSYIGLFNVLCLGAEYSLALTVESNKKNDVSVIAVDEWTGLDNQLVGLQCELLRKNELKA